MSLLKKIVKNSSVIIAGSVADNIINLFLAVYMARYFGQRGMGILSFISVSFFFIAIADSLWVRPIVIREISRDHKNTAVILGNGIIIKVFLCACSLVFFWVCLFAIRPAGEVIMPALLMSVAILLSSVTSSYGMVFQAHLKMGACVVFNLINKMLLLAAMLVIAAHKGGVFDYCLYSLGIYAVTFPFFKSFADRLSKPEFRIDLGLWRVIFKQSWPLALSVLFIFMYHRIDHIMLYAFKGENAIGLYSVGVKISEALSIVAVACVNSALPVLSGYHDTSPAAFKKLYEALFKYLLIFIIPVAFYCTIFPERIISLFFGGDFLPASGSFCILMWAEIFVFLGIVNNTILVAAHKQRIDPIFTGASALINLALNLFLIPAYGIKGAALASLAAYSAGPLIGYFLPQTRAYSQSMFLRCVKPFIASASMFLIVYFMRIGFEISLVAAPVLYLAVLYLIKGIRWNDLVRLEKELL
jgi:O-antigen/teichoic acid export membrane protein